MLISNSLFLLLIRCMRREGGADLTEGTLILSSLLLLKLMEMKPQDSIKIITKPSCPSSFLPRLPSHPGPGVPTWGSIQISAFNKILLPSSSLSICLLCQPHILLIENSPPRVRNTSFLSLFSDLFSYLSTLIFLL